MLPLPLARLSQRLRPTKSLSWPQTRASLSHLLSVPQKFHAARSVPPRSLPCSPARLPNEYTAPNTRLPPGAATGRTLLKQLTLSHPLAAASLDAWGPFTPPPPWHTPASVALCPKEHWRSPRVQILAGSGAGGGPVAGGHYPGVRGVSSGVGREGGGGGKRSSSRSAATAGAPQRWRVPVLIVGAGPVGLTLSFLLSQLGVRSLVVERSQSLTLHPQAHLINNRTMEVFRHMDGLHDEVVRRQPPVHQWRAFVYCTGLLADPLLGTVDHFQGQPQHPHGQLENVHGQLQNSQGQSHQPHQPQAQAPGWDPAAASPTNVAHFSQHRLLPLLLQRALGAGAPLWRPAEGAAGLPGVPRGGGQLPGLEQTQGVAQAQREDDGGRWTAMKSSHAWEAGTGPGTPVLFGWQCTGLEACAEGVQVSTSRSRAPAPQGTPGTQGGVTHGRSSPGSVEHRVGGGHKEALEGVEKDAAEGVGAKEGGAEEGVSDSVVIESEYVVGCDGASSGVRAWAGVAMEGDPCLQRLVSVHFRCAPLGQRLLDMGRPGMLYFVFNADVIAVIVAHSLEEGEFVAQIPYFPPGQTSQDFSPQECERLIRASLGSKAPSSDFPLEVLSVRPWTMSAQVASSFLAPAPSTPPRQPGLLQPAQGKRDRVILAGDAAHRFPPAGGFGMNTGIQDAHNLAWKLAAILSSVSSPRLLDTYQAERAPVARANCALSVSNFYSAMGVATALGLDPRAPRLLQQALESVPVASLLPSPARAALMQQALAVGRAQLSPWVLSPWNPLGALRLEAARANLRDGRSLQLLFPEHDLGFRYGQGTSLKATGGGEGSGRGSPQGRGTGAAEQWSPFRAVAGGRLPHHPFLPVEVSPEGGSTRLVPEAVISSHDLQSPPSLASTLIVSALPASLASWLEQLRPAVQHTRLPVRLTIVAASIDEVEAASETLSLQLASRSHAPASEAPSGRGPRDVAAMASVTPRLQLGYFIATSSSSAEHPRGLSGGSSAQAVARATSEMEDAAQRPLPLCFVLDAGVGARTEHAWWQKIGVPPGGAVLVRPDGHIAWCSQEAEGSQQLLMALQELYRP